MAKRKQRRTAHLEWVVVPRLLRDGISSYIRRWAQEANFKMEDEPHLELVCVTGLLRDNIPIERCVFVKNNVVCDDMRGDQIVAPLPLGCYATQ